MDSSTEKVPDAQVPKKRIVINRVDWENGILVRSVSVKNSRFCFSIRREKDWPRNKYDWVVCFSGTRKQYLSSLKLALRAVRLWDIEYKKASAL